MNYESVNGTSVWAQKTTGSLERAQLAPKVTLPEGSQAAPWKEPSRTAGGQVEARTTLAEKPNSKACCWKFEFSLPVKVSILQNAGLSKGAGQGLLAARLC
jgi:hypothetical protein